MVPGTAAVLVVVVVFIVQVLWECRDALLSAAALRRLAWILSGFDTEAAIAGIFPTLGGSQ
jgi:hypothetical protein